MMICQASIVYSCAMLTRDTHRALHCAESSRHVHKAINMSRMACSFRLVIGLQKDKSQGKLQ
jgi:hypothetical protein